MKLLKQAKDLDQLLKAADHLQAGREKGLDTLLLNRLVRHLKSTSPRPSSNQLKSPKLNKLQVIANKFLRSIQVILIITFHIKRALFNCCFVK